ncbi:MAG: hypothetical protein WC028_31475 [Candidatus Obscuribacterales bacterium]
MAEFETAALLQDNQRALAVHRPRVLTLKHAAPTEGGTDGHLGDAADDHCVAAHESHQPSNPQGIAASDCVLTQGILPNHRTAGRTSDISIVAATLAFGDKTHKHSLPVDCLVAFRLEDYVAAFQHRFAAQEAHAQVGLQQFVGDIGTIVPDQNMGTPMIPDDGQTGDDVIPEDLKTFHGVFLSYTYVDLEAVIGEDQCILRGRHVAWPVPVVSWQLVNESEDRVEHRFSFVYLETGALSSTDKSTERGFSLAAR